MLARDAGRGPRRRRDLVASRQYGPVPVSTDNQGLQLTYCYLDDDPVDAGVRLREPLDARWKETDVKPLLAAPFYTPVPFEWDRYLP